MIVLIRLGFVIVPYIMSQIFDEEVDIEGADVDFENKKVDIRKKYKLD